MSSLNLIHVALNVLIDRYMKTDICITYVCVYVYVYVYVYIVAKY